MISKTNSSKKSTWRNSIEFVFELLPFDDDFYLSLGVYALISLKNNEIDRNLKSKRWLTWEGPQLRQYGRNCL